MPSAGFKFIDYAQGLGLRWPAQAVAVILSTYADKDGLAWPSILTLSEASGVSERNTSKAVQQLEALGVLTIERGLGRGNTSRYRFTLAAPKPNTPELAELILKPEKSGADGGAAVFTGVYDADGNPSHIEINPVP